jgi:hypothetical protein
MRAGYMRSAHFREILGSLLNTVKKRKGSGHVCDDDEVAI